MKINFGTLVIIFLLVLPFHGFSKKKIKEIKVKEVAGEAIGNENESLKQVRERAVNNAKLNALKKAGIQENIQTYTDYFQSETEQEYDELFASSVFTDIQGAVKDVEILGSNKSFTSDNMLRVEVVINCTVIKYLSEADLSFDFEITGIRPNYNNDDLLTFQFTPYKEGYLRAFIFTKSESYQLYPNDYETSRLFQDKMEYAFPLEEINYRLETTKRSEIHRIVFVFIKEDIPFLNKVEYEEIFNWIFSLPPDIRKVKSFSFTVFNGNGD